MVNSMNRCEKCKELRAERDELFRKWSASRSVREQDLEQENKRLLSVINRYKQSREYEIANSLAHVNPLLETEKALFEEVE